MPSSARSVGTGALCETVRNPGNDDVADPYGLDEAAYRRAFDAIADAADRVHRVLVPATQP